MKKKLTLILTLCSIWSYSQNFIGSGGNITDKNTTVFPINVSGLSNKVDSSFGLQSVCFTLSHQKIKELQINLIAPDGSKILLTENVGTNTSYNFTSTCFRASSPNNIRNSIAPFTGYYRPFTMLGAVNNGQNPNGFWSLSITDQDSANVGTLTNWSLTFSSSSPSIPELPYSNLPIIKIKTNGSSIVDEPKTKMWMEYVSDSGSHNYPYKSRVLFEGNIGIEIRGSSSQQFPKKSLGFETWDINNLDSNVTIPGFPAESDWVLCANYSDKSLLRNVLTYDIARKMGWYAPRTQPVELIVDDKYQGVYILMEKIKKSSNRLNIPTLTTTDTAGINLTGGYIFKIDKTTGSGSGNSWNSRYRSSSNMTIVFQPEYPDPSQILPVQKAYLQRYVDSFEVALNANFFQDSATGWRHYADEASFIDYFIINEVAKNVDGLRISTYLHKQKETKKGGKIFAGPVWDYDIAYRNADYCGGDQLTGWAYNFNQLCGTSAQTVPFWWARLMQDTAFVTHLNCRYDKLRAGILSNASINAWVDSMALTLGEGKTRNFNKWPILGTYVWPNPTPIPNTYSGEIANLKSNIATRLSWLDANIPGQCWGIPLSNEEEIHAPALIYPNPTNDVLFIALSHPIKEICLFNLAGQLVQKQNTNSLQLELNLQDLAGGVYWLKLGNEMRKVIIQHP